MLSIWYFVLGVVGGFVIGVLGIGGTYLLWDTLKKIFLKKNMPKDDARLLNPGKPEPIGIKEEQNDYDALNKHREWERLRRFNILEKSDSGIRKPSRADDSREGSFGRDAEVIRRHILQDNESEPTKQDVGRTDQAKQSPRFTRPEFL